MRAFYKHAWAEDKANVLFFRIVLWRTFVLYYIERSDIRLQMNVRLYYIEYPALKLQATVQIPKFEHSNGITNVKLDPLPQTFN